MPTTKKALNYDLDDKLLQKYYPNPKSYKNAWTAVKNIFIKKVLKADNILELFQSSQCPML